MIFDYTEGLCNPHRTYFALAYNPQMTYKKPATPKNALLRAPITHRSVKLVRSYVGVWTLGAGGAT